MFFFFFGGINPEVSKVIERTVAECPRCGSDASLVEYDIVFRAFFFPVWRWGNGSPAIHCERCSYLQSLEEFQKLHRAPEHLLLPAPSSPPRSPPSSPPPVERRAPSQTPDFGPSAPPAPSVRCWACTSVLEPEFRFCPRCGSKQEG